MAALPGGLAVTRGWRSPAEWSLVALAAVAGAALFNLGRTPFFAAPMIEEDVVVPAAPGADCAWNLDLQRHRCRFRVPCQGAGCTETGWANPPEGVDLMAPYATLKGKTMLLSGMPAAPSQPATLRCQLHVRGRVPGFAARWSPAHPWIRLEERTWMAEVVSCRAP